MAAFNIVKIDLADGGFEVSHGFQIDVLLNPLLVVAQAHPLVLNVLPETLERIRHRQTGLFHQSKHRLALSGGRVAGEQGPKTIKQLFIWNHRGGSWRETVGGLHAGCGGIPLGEIAALQRNAAQLGVRPFAFQIERNLSRLQFCLGEVLNLQAEADQPPTFHIMKFARHSPVVVPPAAPPLQMLSPHVRIPLSRNCPEPAKQPIRRDHHASNNIRGLETALRP